MPSLIWCTTYKVGSIFSKKCRLQFLLGLLMSNEAAVDCSISKSSFVSKTFSFLSFIFYFQLWNLNCQSTFWKLTESTRKAQIHFWYPGDSIEFTILLASKYIFDIPRMNWIYKQPTCFSLSFNKYHEGVFFIICF